MRRILSFLALNLILQAQVQKEEIPATHETVYRVTDGNGCNLSLTLSQTEPNRKTAQLRESCALPLDRALSMSGQILDTLERDDPQRLRALATLFIGGLSSLPDMRRRLVLLAKDSGAWDSVQGKPKSGSADAFVQKYAGQSELLKGWEEMFRRYGIRVEVGGVENVRVEKAGSLAFFDELRRYGIGANDRVPSTCLLWIRLVRTGEGDRK